MDGYQLFWGETHDNVWQFADSAIPVEESARRAASHLDFYVPAYYTSCSPSHKAGGHITQGSGTRLMPEQWKSPQRLEREWADVQRVAREMNQPGRFAVFPGYEWQGDGSGDHNVICLNEGVPIFRANTIGELYAGLRGYDAIAIPHHTGYQPGMRGRDWTTFDENLSPFAELFSIHGCSETDEEWIGLRRNHLMGPGVSGSTYQDALDMGHHVGAVCSTDNWGDMPGHYGQGRMACFARELTRESLWEAFKARRVYGVTGDRIALDFQVNGAPMGSIIQANGNMTIKVNVVGSDCLDRIEILRNGRVLATHCHQGTWQMPEAGTLSRFKLRIEAGWGPRPSELSVPDRVWNGKIAVSGGRVIDFEPCWISPGQTNPVISGESAAFGLFARSKDAAEPAQNSIVFEFEARMSSGLHVSMNGQDAVGTVADFASGSRVLWLKDESIRVAREQCGVTPDTLERKDFFYVTAQKAKLHRAVPEAAYKAEFVVEDDEPLSGETNYRVRVEQRNGQRAWSSPIWVGPSDH